MKMNYEQPKMMVELYRANQYVAACTGYEFKGDYEVEYSSVKYGDWTFTFNSGTQTRMINTNNGQEQNYWVANQQLNGMNVYLEFSAYYDGAPILYLDHASSGFQNGNNSAWVGGVGSLQVNNAMPNSQNGIQVGEFAKEGGYIYRQNSSYKITNPTTGEDVNWTRLFADECLGAVEPNPYNVPVVMS